MSLMLKNEPFTQNLKNGMKTKDKNKNGATNSEKWGEGRKGGGIALQNGIPLLGKVEKQEQKCSFRSKRKRECSAVLI